MCGYRARVRRVWFMCRVCVMCRVVEIQKLKLKLKLALLLRSSIAVGVAVGIVGIVAVAG